ncbi:MAG TPA: acyltransferase [Burkholderiales bacterium]|nr:acyltransferase [Burkholderiales bacterium]
MASPPPRSPPSFAPASQRIYGLDILRACAILCVLFLHSSLLLDGYPALCKVLTAVPDGVSMFFVLSGYLIGMLLLRRVTQPEFGLREALDFWLRRWLRTLPAYYLVLVLVYFIAVRGGQPPPVRLPDYIFFVQNLAWPHPGFFGEAWSLAVEEWFYLLLPLPPLIAARLWPRLPRDRLLLAWAALCLVGAPLFRASLAGAHGIATPDWDLWLRKIVLVRMDAPAFGVLGAWLHTFRPRLWQRHARTAFAAGIALLIAQRLLLTAFDPAWYMNYAYLSLDCAGFLLLLPALSALHTGSGPAYRFVRLFSTLAYGLYLVHFNLVLMNVLPRLAYFYLPVQPAAFGSAMMYLGFWSLSLLLAALLHLCWEKPFMQWRDRRLRREPALDLCRIAA